MTQIALMVLQVLSQDGPCSNADCARKLKRPLHVTYKAMGELVARSCATHPKRQRWAITPVGETALKELSGFLEGAAHAS